MIGGIAFAAIPNGGAISGCYRTSGGDDSRAGTLRVIDSAAGQTCRKDERAISWSQTGPPGAVGATGTKGDPGPAGPPGGGQDGRYAHILSSGLVDSGESNGISQANITHPDIGLYCIVNLGPIPKNLSATVGDTADSISVHRDRPGGSGIDCAGQNGISFRPLRITPNGRRVTESDFYVVFR